MCVCIDARWLRTSRLNETETGRGDGRPGWVKGVKIDLRQGGRMERGDEVGLDSNTWPGPGKEGYIQVRYERPSRGDRCRPEFDG